MSLKRRLIITNAAVIIVPLLVTVAATFVFVYISSRVFNTDVSYKNIENMARIRYELFKAEGSILQKSPEVLMEKEFQQYLTGRLAASGVEIVALKKHDVIFSTSSISKIDIEKCLNWEKKNIFGSTIELGGSNYAVDLSPVTFKTGEKGTVILLAPVGSDVPASENFIIFAVVVFLMSFLLTNALQSYAFSRSIIKPLSRLQSAAEEISRGNLDCEVIEEGAAEIRKLCISFEEMRLKLRQSVYTQMKYDDNRKMLVSSISHDLKTPMTSIKGYVEGILDGVANTPEKTEKYLKTIYSKAVQVDSMIDDLLLYSKLDLKQIPFDFEKTDIVKYFEDCIAESEHELEKANIHISLHNHLTGYRYAMIDRSRIRRVVINIIDNARKYMKNPHGNIDIILREKASDIIIEIKDNGAGILKEDLPHIFDRFYRADAARSSISGSGLGLAIAKQIVEGHGGKIWVRSRENEGTSVMISLKKMEQEESEYKP